MEVSGKIIAVLPPQGGVSKAGREWKKQEYVLETHDSFPRKVKFDFFGDRVDQYPMAIGDEVTISFDIESREFNGRWYTDIHGWKAEKGVPGQAPVGPAPGFGQPTAAPQPQDATQAPGFPDPFAGNTADADGDLPF
ncbi:MAG: DUF3127 domain-containing protein [Prevotella sp.]|nr:DUF3127 domain-containing protein [Prevotella sp.]MCM1074961.1 DUF3127 domain-containing protein [Ruminococcus sp.]